MNEKTISITTKKTKDKLIIPLHRSLEAILKKNDMELPSANNIVQNRLIKQIAKDAGLKEIVAKREFCNGL